MASHHWQGRLSFLPLLMLDLVWACSKASKEWFTVEAGCNFISDVVLNEQFAIAKRRRSYLALALMCIILQTRCMLECLKNVKAKNVLVSLLVSGFHLIHRQEWEPEKVREVGEENFYFLAVARCFFNLVTVWNWISRKYCLCGIFNQPTVGLDRHSVFCNTAVI